MLMPLPRNSSPIATARRRIRSLSQVAPTVIYVNQIVERLASGFTHPSWKGGVVVSVAVKGCQS